MRERPHHDEEKVMATAKKRTTTKKAAAKKAAPVKKAAPAPEPTPEKAPEKAPEPVAAPEPKPTPESTSKPENSEKPQSSHGSLRTFTIKGDPAKWGRLYIREIPEVEIQADEIERGPNLLRAVLAEHLDVPEESFDLTIDPTP